MAKQNFDDEIDLIALFETFWQRKWVISVFVILAVLLGLVYSKVAIPKYKVSASYFFNAYPVSSIQLCAFIQLGKNDENLCVEAALDKTILASLGDNWVAKEGYLSLITTSPKDISNYQADFENLNGLLTNEVYQEALSETALINKYLSDSMLSSETATNNFITAQRLINQFDSGKKLIAFGPVSIKKISPREKLILPISFVLGVLLGCGYALIRSVVQARREEVSPQQ